MAASTVSSVPPSSAAPAGLFETLTVTLQGDKSSLCGFRTNSSLVVQHVERGSPADNRLKFGDLIVALDRTPQNNKRTFVDVLKKKVTAAAHFKIDLKIKRPICSLPMDSKRMPKGVETIPGCKYRLAVLHRISGCPLGLHIKSFNNKVYVSNVDDNTLAAMTLQVGDVILDVEEKALTSVEDVQAVLFKHLKEKGHATMVIESPDDPATKAFVRTALLAQKTQEANLPLPPDVVQICRSQVAKMRATSKSVSVRSVLRNDKKPARPSSSHLRIKDQTEDIPIACDGNPNLLVKVPLAPASQYQPLNIFQTPADQKK